MFLYVMVIPSPHPIIYVQVELVADNKHRPQDLRTLALRGAIDSKSSVAYALCNSVAHASGAAWERLLTAGCVIAQEMRAALKVVAGSLAQPCPHFTNCLAHVLQTEAILQ